MKKMFLILLLLIVALPVKNASAFSGGLLNGLASYNPYGNVTTTTDGDASTYWDLVKTSDAGASAPTYKAGLAYKLTGSDRMTVSSYRLKATGNFIMYMYNAAGSEISKQTITADDTVHTIATVQNVRQISLFNSSSTAVARVYEFDVFGTAHDLTAPKVPTDLIGNANDGEVILNWNANSESDIAGYRVYKDGILYTTVTTPTATVTGLTNGTNYTFSVSAIDNVANESGKANIVLTPIQDPKPILKPTLDVVIVPEKIGLGQEFTADISLKNVKDIYAEDFELKYDNEHLQYIGFEEATGYKVYNKPVDQNGALRFVIASQGEEYGISKDTIILKLKFKAKAIGTAVVDSTKGRVANTEGEYDLDKENCLEDSIIIEASDVNKSGEYTLVDLAIDAKYFKYLAADVDPSKYNSQQAGDEYVNDDDLLFIVEQILNNPDYLPNI
ncbi:hypothetical protein HNR77_003562 [Paenibacillus sp. JGP012]|uniref:cohesin domain-containing protein n=1 Tax=Paenibacillus sp. JGP012 TaxID=2735914 RepID=UPI0016085F60|nr:cohesin domain-containing protein [Paenibacillus sp. JGP012]MBB6022465.1 hypothetical protein [Paenibacillus sp. JGP012]